MFSNQTKCSQCQTHACTETFESIIAIDVDVIFEQLFLMSYSAGSTVVMLSATCQRQLTYLY